MRAFLAGALAVVGLVLVPLADAGVWTQHRLLDADGFAELSLDVLHQPEVTDALTRRLTDEVVARASLPSAAQPVVQSGVSAVLRTEEFEQVSRAAVGAMHSQLERGDPALVLDFNGALPAIRARVASIDPDVAAEIPEGGLPVFTVVRESEARTVFRTVDLVRDVSLVIPIVTVVLIVGAVAVSIRRARLLVVLGISILTIALALALLVQVGRDALTEIVGPEVEIDAFAAGYDTVTATFVAQTALLAAIGVVLGVVGAALTWRQTRNRRPLRWA